MANCNKIQFSGHSIRKMFERRISKFDIECIIHDHEIIKSYLDDEPFPSYLILGYIRKKPLHIVIAQNNINLTCIVITVYEPDPNIWFEDFRKKR
jgi:hypothetical protein